MTRIKRKTLAALLLVVLMAAAAIAINLTTVGSASAIPNTDVPQITVLTHGLGGNAAHWSSTNGTGTAFAQDNDSLLQKLSTKAGGANLYRAATSGGNSPSYTLYADYGNTTATINSVSKHIIIVFESGSAGASNAVVYSEFRHMLNSVIARVQSLAGRAPKVNLIGHSRGGITNLLYALDYPENVHSMISLGTPFFGSDAAVSFGELVFGSSAGLTDINNASLYNSYYQRWVSGYESKYKNINSIAIGGDSAESSMPLRSACGNRRLATS